MTTNVQLSPKDIALLDNVQGWCVKTRLFLEDHNRLTPSARELLIQLYHTVNNVLEFDWNEDTMEDNEE